MRELKRKAREIERWVCVQLDSVRNEEWDGDEAQSRWKERKNEKRILWETAFCEGGYVKVRLIYTRLDFYRYLVFLVGSIWFTGFSYKTKTEPNRLDFMVLKIILISFSS